MLGGIFLAIINASQINVPDPHMGSIRGVSELQPLNFRIPAAKTSFKGATPVIVLYPLLKSGSPDVFHNKLTWSWVTLTINLWSGATLSTLGLVPLFLLNWSTIASFIFKETYLEWLKNGECTMLLIEKVSWMENSFPQSKL